MNLNEFTSPLPKMWLDINANSINVVNSYTQNDFSLGSFSTNSGTGTLNISPANLINGVIGANGAGPRLDIVLPTAAAINSYLGNQPALANLSFSFTVCVSRTATSAVQLTLNTGLTTFDGLAFVAIAPYTVPNGSQRVFYFSRNPSTLNWVIYY